MATQASTIAYLLAQASDAGDISAKKLFGDYGIYCDGKLVGVVCDDQLFLRPTQAARAFLGDIIEAKPYPTAKPSYLIAGERWDDGDWLSQLVKTSAAALPRGKPRKTSAGRT